MIFFVLFVAVWCSVFNPTLYIPTTDNTFFFMFNVMWLIAGATLAYKLMGNRISN